jgi:hypothetical protein
VPPLADIFRDFGCWQANATACVATSPHQLHNRARPAPDLFFFIFAIAHPALPVAHVAPHLEDFMNYPTRLKPLFHPGRLLVTPAASAALRASGVPVISVLLRHICGDWGDMPDAEWQQNDLSIGTGLRLLSVYNLPGGERLCMITEWDRSSTAVHLTGDRRIEA